MNRLLAAIAVVLAASPAFANSDGFDVFWKQFSQAAGSNDQAAIQSMVKFPIGGAEDGSEANFPNLYDGLFSAEARACLAKDKPEKDELGQYNAFCGEEIFVFSKMPEGWKLTDFGVND